MKKQIEKIWLEYHTKLLSFINSKVKDEAIAEDILQDIFVRIQTHIDTIKDEEKNNGGQVLIFE